MSRWVVLAVAVIAALGIGAGLTQLRVNVAEDRASRAASAGNPAGSDDELVARLLTPPYSPSGKEQAVALVRGSLPATPKLDAPMPSGSRLIGSVVRSSGGSPSNVQVLLDEPGTTAEIVAFYDRELAALGWRAQPDKGQPSGFVPSNPPTGKMYCKTDTVPWLSLSVAAKDKAPSDVRLSYQLSNEGFGGGGPCSSQGFGPAQPMQSRIPVLRAPSDVVFRGGSGMGGGPDSQASETSVTTSRSVTDLETFFAAQLTSAGWSHSDGGSSGPIAWSTWKVPGDGTWTGVLFVLETSPNARLLSVRAQAASAR